MRLRLRDLGDGESWLDSEKFANNFSSASEQA